MKSFFITTLVAFSVLACSPFENNAVIIDNPTSEKITFELDGKSFTMEGLSSQKIELENGNHTLKTPDGKEIRFEKYKGQVESILNPTNSEYVLVTKAYTDIPFEENRMYKGYFKNVVIDGQTFYGPFELTGGYYIGRNRTSPWRFGLDENFEETINVKNHKEGTTYNLMVAKIYRISDFKKKYQDNLVQ